MTQSANKTTLTTSELVPLATAQDCIGRYVTSQQIVPDPTYAFIVSHNDIMDALGIKKPVPPMDFKQFRVYFGLSPQDLDYKMRLFLVPVDDAGNDVLPLDADGNMCVYDFNAPCPATCDINSPLYYGNLSA
ncbi:MAG: hypothetical protein ABIQ40_14675 [Bacteroidia bacterium]